MKIPINEISPPAQALMSELRGYGFVAQEERYEPKSFGNALVVLRRNKTLVRLVRDRGIWSIEVAGGSSGAWFPPVVWRAFLRSSMPPLEIAMFDVQAPMLLADLPEIETANREFGEAELEALRNWQRRRASAFGIIPPIADDQEPN